MKDTICDYDLLLIRQCKKNNTSIDILRKIISKRNALSYNYVTKADVVYFLTKIVLDYELIRNMVEFITVDLNPKKWWGDTELSYQDNLIEQLISVISNTEVAKFPRYPRSAWFRNKYPEKN